MCSEREETSLDFGWDGLASAAGRITPSPTMRDRGNRGVAACGADLERLLEAPLVRCVRFDADRGRRPARAVGRDRHTPSNAAWQRKLVDLEVLFDTGVDQLSQR